MDFEEAGHKLMKIGIQPGQEIEMVTMIIECCSQVRLTHGPLVSASVNPCLLGCLNDQCSRGSLPSCLSACPGQSDSQAHHMAGKWP